MATRLALTNGRLVDGTGAPPREGWSIVVDGARIHAVGPAGAVTIPGDARVVDELGRDAANEAALLVGGDAPRGGGIEAALQLDVGRGLRLVDHGLEAAQRLPVAA